jgi:hypothetical protein
VHNIQKRRQRLAFQVSNKRQNMYATVWWHGMTHEHIKVRKIKSQGKVTHVCAAPFVSWHLAVCVDEFATSEASRMTVVCAR